MSENLEIKNTIKLKSARLNEILDTIKANESVQILAKDLKPKKCFCP